MGGMAGKASGRCRPAEGVYGRFSPTADGFCAAASWRDGQTAHDPDTRPAWAILELGGWTWCLPPTMAAHAAVHPEWIPEWPFDLEPLERKLELVAAAAAAGLPAPGVIPPWPPRK